MPLRAVLVFIALFTGGFMLLDGTRNLLTGTYFGTELGPWSLLVNALGLDAAHFGAVFASFGIVWLVGLVALLRGAPWGWPAALIVALATLWYLPVGTLFSLVYAALLIRNRAALRTAPRATR